MGENNLPFSKIQVKPGISAGIKQRLDRGHHQGGMGRGDQLHLGLFIKQPHDAEQGGHYAALPAGVQVRFNLVDQEGDLGGHRFPQLLGRLLVLLPGPHQQIGQG